jgi:hypothetical protein
MQETESVSPAEPFSQGDVVRIVDADGNRADPPYGIIINADCDLAHCKIDGVVAYVPVFPFLAYFEKFWIPKFADTRRKELADAIANHCDLNLDQYEALFGWLKEEPWETVTSKICSTYSVKFPDLQNKIRELWLIINATKFDWELLDTLVGFQKGNKEEFLARQAKRALKSLGEGHFFLNEISGLPNVGFVARMRRIYSLDSESVFSSQAAFLCRSQTSGLFGIRIAKLTSLYRFKVAQLFALQFSRIGLPDEITSLNEIAVEAAVSNVRGDNA